MDPRILLTVLVLVVSSHQFPLIPEDDDTPITSEDFGIGIIPLDEAIFTIYEIRRIPTNSSDAEPNTKDDSEDTNEDDVMENAPIEIFITRKAEKVNKDAKKDTHIKTQAKEDKEVEKKEMEPVKTAEKVVDEIDHDIVKRAVDKINNDILAQNDFNFVDEYQTNLLGPRMKFLPAWMG